MFGKILIANRGEIACRVVRTARRMGIHTVAIYSDADAHALHVSLADEAERIGPPPARESYLDIDAMIRAARRSGAEAVHPGYGFLSENEAFARRCEAEGLVFIGPPPAAIAAMGSKSAAKRIMEGAGVPLVPGYHGEDQSDACLQREAQRIGYPVLIKASAGGGGKGMRIVETPARFADALSACKREAASAFGDDKVLIERYLVQPRHIEIQVFADRHGHAVSLFERDCSVQRRHQKVLEEAPAPGMTAARRSEMGEAAVAAARAIGYVGAGTVEFIVGADGHFHFMEMNTRLQVEHPVTEMITGLDLVEWQLRVASGEPLPLGQQDLGIDGHALEARIYAEDPENDFLPATGTIAHLALPPTSRHVRIDTGVRAGDAITPFYDPMIAKLIVWDRDRDRALARMRGALAQVEIAGLRTNVRFLQRLVTSRPFASAALDTGLIERHRSELLPPASPASEGALALATLAELVTNDAASRARTTRSGDPHSPWGLVDGWRLNQDNHHTFAFRDGEVTRPVTVHYRGGGYEIEHDARRRRLSGRAEGARIEAWLDGQALHGTVVRNGLRREVFARGEHVMLTLIDPFAHEVEEVSPGGGLTAPMPGKIIAVLAKAGSVVEAGAPLLIMEAMKMEHTIAAPSKGTVKELHYGVGEQVAEGAELVTFEAAAA